MDQQNDRLVRQSSAMAKTLAASLKPQEIMLLRELRVTAANAKVTLVADLNEEFLRVLSEYPAEAIESAFRGWRDVSPFFPAVSHILDLCMHWVRRQAEETEMRQRRLEREKLDAARAAGELVDFADIKKELLSIAVFPDKPNEHQKRQQAAIERLRRSEMPPALPLTPEQIKSRRADEQAEIRRYSER